MAWSWSSKQARVAGGAGAVVVLGVAGVLFLRQGPTEAPVAPPPATIAAVDPAPATEAPAVQAPAAAPEVAVPAPAVLPPEPPRFELVRVESDGSATVAGVAAPGVRVHLRLDGAELASVQADASGQFATLVTLPPAPVARLMSLAMDWEGGEIAGRETVAIAPVIAPVAAPDVVAAAEPAPVPNAEPPAETPTLAPPPATLLVTEGGVKVLQPGAGDAAAVQANVTIDSVAYTPEGQVQVGGRGQGKALVRLYLDGAPLTDVAVADDGQWQVTLPETAPGIYTLRADQLDAEGKVTSRFETPFKRETPEALAAVLAPPAVPQPQSEPAAAPPAAVLPAPDAVAAPESAPAPAAVPEVAAAPPGAPPADAAPMATAEAPATGTATGAAPQSVAAVPAAEPPPAAPRPVTVTVQPGFTLWGIAEERFGNGVLYVQVFEANKDKIRDPDLIYPGQVFTMPGD